VCSGTVTAGNASTLNDAASALVLMTLTCVYCVCVQVQ